MPYFSFPSLGTNVIAVFQEIIKLIQCLICLRISDCGEKKSIFSSNKIKFNFIILFYNSKIANLVDYAYRLFDFVSEKVK